MEVSHLIDCYIECPCIIGFVTGGVMGRRESKLACTTANYWPFGADEAVESDTIDMRETRTRDTAAMFEELLQSLAVLALRARTSSIFALPPCIQHHHCTDLAITPPRRSAHPILEICHMHASDNIFQKCGPVHAICPAPHPIPPDAFKAL